MSFRSLRREAPRARAAEAAFREPDDAVEAELRANSTQCSRSPRLSSLARGPLLKGQGREQIGRKAGNAFREGADGALCGRTSLPGRGLHEDELVVDIAGFEGPLDLLLHLARSQRVDLSRISVLALAEQYIAFVERARSIRIELAADYLVMAAWLAYPQVAPAHPPAGKG